MSATFQPPLLAVSRGLKRAIGMEDLDLDSLVTDLEAVPSPGVDAQAPSAACDAADERDVRCE